MECALCYETCTFYGLTECEHRSVCSLCWYRLTSILKKTSCPVCRHECSCIFITSDLELSYSSIFETRWGDTFPGYSHDELSNMHFKDQSELNRLLAFRKLVCKVCKQEFGQIKPYKEHLSLYHALRLCEQCLQNNKLFPAEQTSFEEEALRIHKVSMHVQCDLCYSFHYDQRELLIHVKNQHFFCELCPVEKRTAFAIYEELEAHYRQAHYLCEVEMCKDMRNIVFMVYNDLKDHFRCEHPSLSIPAPVLGFKLRDSEKETFVFEDVSSKNYSAPKINDKNKDFEFPALASATTEIRAIDYTKMKSQKSQKPGTDYPALATSSQQSVFSPPQVKKIQAKPKKKGISQVSQLEKNILRLNNGHLSTDQLVEWMQNEHILIDSTLISLLRDKILSNSDGEKVIIALRERKTSVKPEFKEEEEEEEKKSSPMGKPSGKCKAKDFSAEDFPSLGPTRKIAPKTNMQTLIENIVILNNGLISCKCFVETMLSFAPRGEINSMRQVIREKVRPESRSVEVLRILDYSLLITAYDNEYPSLSQAKISVKKSCIELIMENVKNLNSGVVNVKEFLDLFIERITELEAKEAIKIIKENIYNSNLSSQVLKPIQTKFGGIINQQDFPKLKMVSLPPEPKKVTRDKKK